MSILSALGLLNGLNLGRRALSSQQAGLQTTGRNIANVNTPGYTRQRAITGVTDSRADKIAGQQLPHIDAVRNVLTERLLLQERSLSGNLTRQSELLSQIEAALNEPSDSGLSAAMNRFFAAAGELAGTPESPAAKTQLIERAEVVASTFRSAARQLDTVSTENAADARATVATANTTIEQIRLLNAQIARTTDKGSKVELQSHQEELIRQLADVVSVRMLEADNGTRTVQLSGLALVDGSFSSELVLKEDVSGQLSLSVSMSGQEMDAQPRGGTLQGIFEAQNAILPAIANDIHGVALALVDEVNAVHTGFFRPLTDSQQRARAAAFVEVLVQDASDVTASSTGTSGGNDVILALAALDSGTISELDGASIPGFYRELVAAVGTRAAEMDQRRQTSDLVLQQLQERRESISGVSLDEEAMNLVMFQRAYEAAARYVQVVDELLETLIRQI